MSKSWGSEDELLAELKEALATAGDPEQGITAGYAAWSWRAVNDELETALLKYDSYVDAPMRVRGAQASEARVLIFQGANEASLEIEVVGEQLIGQLVPPRTAKIVLLVQEGIETETTTDDLGCFSFHAPDRVFRLQCVAPDTALVTEWVRL